MLTWILHPRKTLADRRALEERHARGRERAAEYGAFRVIIFE